MACRFKRCRDCFEAEHLWSVCLRFHSREKKKGLQPVLFAKLLGRAAFVGRDVCHRAAMTAGCNYARSFRDHASTQICACSGLRRVDTGLDLNGLHTLSSIVQKLVLFATLWQGRTLTKLGSHRRLCRVGGRLRVLKAHKMNGQATCSHS